MAFLKEDSMMPLAYCEQFSEDLDCSDKAEGWLVLEIQAARQRLLSRAAERVGNRFAKCGFCNSEAKIGVIEVAGSNEVIVTLQLLNYGLPHFNPEGKP